VHLFRRSYPDLILQLNLSTFHKHKHFQAPLSLLRTSEVLEFESGKFKHFKIKLDFQGWEVDIESSRLHLQYRYDTIIWTVNRPQAVSQSEESKSSVRAAIPEATGTLGYDDTVTLYSRHLCHVRSTTGGRRLSANKHIIMFIYYHTSSEVQKHSRDLHGNGKLTHSHPLPHQLYPWITTISATNHIGHDYIGHRRNRPQTTSYTISATSKAHIGHRQYWVHKLFLLYTVWYIHA